MLQQIINYLLQDIIILQARALTQVYCHFNIHNIFYDYEYIFYFIFYSILLCFSVDAVYYDMIIKNIKFPIDEISITNNLLDLLLGSNAFICILLSSLCIWYRSCNK